MPTGSLRCARPWSAPYPDAVRAGPADTAARSATRSGRRARGSMIGTRTHAPSSAPGITSPVASTGPERTPVQVADLEVDDLEVAVVGQRPLPGELGHQGLCAATGWCRRGRCAPPRAPPSRTYRAPVRSAAATRRSSAPSEPSGTKLRVAEASGSGVLTNVHSERANGRVTSPVWSSVSPTNSRRPTFTG